MVNPKESLPLKLRTGLGNYIGLNKHLPDWMLYVKVHLFLFTYLNNVNNCQSSINPLTPLKMI